jgi:hypothetical protein
MEQPGSYGLGQPEEDQPSAILTLTDCQLDLNRIGENIIVMRFHQKGLGYLIDVPWDENDFRMMIAAWQARLGARINGKGTSSD